MVNYRSATGLPLTCGQTVEIETSICFCHRSSGRPVADAWLKGGYSSMGFFGAELLNVIRLSSQDVIEIIVGFYDVMHTKYLKDTGNAYL